jgi:hypothetical protein
MQVAYEPWSVKNEDNDVWGFKILDGRFEGTVISINEFKLADDTTGEAALDFNFIQKPRDATDEELTSQDFNDTIGGIINDILTRAIENYEHETRKDNSTESDSR